MFFVQFQRLGKGVAQSLQKGQRTAQEQDVSGNASALCQTGDRLVHHRLENACGDVLPACALVQQGLDVRLGEHAAPGGNGIDLFCRQRHFIQLIHAHVQQGRHLVNECARTAGTAAVHALFYAAGEKDDLRILAAQLDNHICLGIALLDRQERSVYFLDKGQLCRLRQSQSGRAGDADPELSIRIFLRQLCQLCTHGLTDLGKMAFIAGRKHFAFFCQQNRLDSGRTHVNSQCIGDLLCFKHG